MDESIYVFKEEATLPPTHLKKPSSIMHHSRLHDDPAEHRVKKLSELVRKITVQRFMKDNAKYQL
jgi:hypothetical protein